MTTVNIRGIPISFPFKPYDIQKDYMEKVLECMQNETNGVLESPTGTGKTLSLLCSSLAWLTVQKAKFQAEARNCGNFFTKENRDQKFPAQLLWDIPTIIYASRTHSQLTQAMQELKRTSYAHVKSTIIGSRDQLCIHPEVAQELNNANKIHKCQALVKARSCHLHNRVERMSLDRTIHEMNIADIEDLVKLGQKHKFCPFYMTKELKKQADIVFLPYNYLLDPKARRANQLDLKNSVVILDEAHNVERVCEDSASFQIRTTDITLCIEEITQIMKHYEVIGEFSGDSEKDFTAEELVILKTMLLKLEKVIDEIPLMRGEEGSTYEGKYIFEILNQAGINDSSQASVTNLLEKLVQFMSASRANPFQRTGVGLQTLQDLLMIVFQNISAEFKEKINKCYKVHVCAEEGKKKGTTGTWLSKASSSTKTACRVLSYWCFSPNFGMQMLLEQGIRCVILTSGTLAPLKPLISELGINIGVRLENPHVVDDNQISVKILSAGPDGEPLNAGFQNRDNQKYVSSLGMTIVNVCRQIPNGLLIFFPSYALLSKCQEKWQASGIWNSLNDLKMIFVEPKTKDAFTTVMTSFYDRVKDPAYKGAVFMAVCRGKVSEGLDFADINGRAVIITGLPYPPFKDPKVVLKRKYLDLCRSKNPEYLSGQDWYGLEAIRAVNQAIGRVIRHRYDYGAILLLDNRFNNNAVKNQLSLWVRKHVKVAKNFSEVIRDMRTFFKTASQFDDKKEVRQETSKCSSTSVGEAASSTYGEVQIYKSNKTINEPSASNSVPQIDLTSNDSPEKNVNSDNKRTPKLLENNAKRRKFVLVKPDYSTEKTATTDDRDTYEFIELLKKNLDRVSYEKFIKGLGVYKAKSDIDNFIEYLNEIFKPKPHLRYLIQGMLPYVKDVHKDQFLVYWESMR